MFGAITTKDGKTTTLRPSVESFGPLKDQNHGGWILESVDTEGVELPVEGQKSVNASIHLGGDGDEGDHFHEYDTCGATRFMCLWDR